MPLQGIARMISTILYSKRFFPFYVYNILGGLDEEGKGAVYSFDPVGSYEREFCRAAGAAQSLLQPFLDSQVRECGENGATRCFSDYLFLLHFSRSCSKTKCRLLLDRFQSQGQCSWIKSCE